MSVLLQFQWLIGDHLVETTCLYVLNGQHTTRPWTKRAIHKGLHPLTKTLQTTNVNNINGWICIDNWLRYDIYHPSFFYTLCLIYSSTDRTLFNDIKATDTYVKDSINFCRLVLLNLDNALYISDYCLNIAFKVYERKIERLVQNKVNQSN